MSIRVLTIPEFENPCAQMQLCCWVYDKVLLILLEDKRNICIHIGTFVSTVSSLSDVQNITKELWRENVNGSCLITFCTN